MYKAIYDPQKTSVTARNPQHCQICSQRHKEVMITVQERQVGVVLFKNNEKLEDEIF